MTTTRKVSRKTSGKKPKKSAVEGTHETPISQSNGHDTSDLNAASSNGSNGNGTHNRIHEPSFEQIQLRAYELFVARGYSHGDDIGDWLTAENELKNGSLRVG